MMIDIFQYSNMYTLRKSMQWLADKDHIRDECGPYVTKPGRHPLTYVAEHYPHTFAGFPIPDWPTLLHLYSRFRAGKTVRDWMEEYEVHKLNIDVRRFTSFAVIKVRSPKQLCSVVLTSYSRDSCVVYIGGPSCSQLRSKPKTDVLL